MGEDQAGKRRREGKCVVGEADARAKAPWNVCSATSGRFASHESLLGEAPGAQKVIAGTRRRHG
jgi:hypothetical protein